MSPFILLMIFLFVILPAARPPMFAAPAVVAMEEQAQQTTEALVLIIFALKNLFPHSFRDYQSPYYIQPRPKELWQDYMLTQWSDQYFRESFRMDKSSFYELCNLLRTVMQRRDSNFRKALTVETRVAIGLYRLASEHCPYRTIRDIFGVGQGTACKIVRNFVHAIVEVSFCVQGDFESLRIFPEDC